MKDCGDLFERHCTNIKATGKDQFIARCPFPPHEDRNPSFSFNNEGLYKCHSKKCGEEGNAVDFAKHFGEDPKPFYSDGYKSNKPLINSRITAIKNNINIQVEEPVKPSKIDKTFIKKAAKYSFYLFDNWNVIKGIPKNWNKDQALKMGIGYDRGKNCFTFTQYNVNGAPVCLQWHKQSTDGQSPQIGQDKSAKWYPAQLIHSYDKKGRLIITEGLKDCVGMIALGYQAASVTAGAGSIPKDGSIIRGFKEYQVIYDNDSSGYSGGFKIANHIQSRQPGIVVPVAQWDKDLPKGYDLTDAINGDIQTLKRAIKNSKKRIGDFEFITGKAAADIEIEDVSYIVDTLVPKNFKTILAGTTGSNKSYWAMEMGMRVANGNPDFLGYNIPDKQKVLYVDIEVGVKETTRRFQRISKTIHFKNELNFNFLSRVGTLKDIIPEIRTACKILKPDLVIIDNLRGISTKDLSKNLEVDKVTGKLNEIITELDITMILIHHFKKKDSDVRLDHDMMLGASALQNWAEHLILLVKTNIQNIRLMKIDKSRGSLYSEEVYGIRWNPNDFVLEMDGIYPEWKHLLLNENKRLKYEQALEDLPDGLFTTKDWLNVTENRGRCVARTANYWLSDAVTAGLVKKVGHGNYLKSGLQIIHNESLE